MAQFILKRTISSLFTLFLFLTFLFFVAQIIMPGDFASQFAVNPDLGPEEIEEIRGQLGLNLPLGKQYLLWLRSLFNGRLGTSYSGVPVSSVLQAVLPFTFLIFFPGTAIAFLLGQWLGKVTAWRGKGLLSSSLVLGGITLYTSFPPWLVFLMTYFFARYFDLMRSLVDLDSPRHLWRNSAWPPRTIIWYVFITFAVFGLLVAAVNRVLRRASRKQLRIPVLPGLILVIVCSTGCWYLLGFGAEAMDILYFAVMPVITYALLSFGETMLIMRTSMIDTLRDEYILVARAKGLPERVVRDKHAARNAVLPVVSRLFINLPYLLTGLAFIEYSFGLGGVSGLALYPTLRAAYGSYWSGMGSTLYAALFQQDIPLVLGLLLFVGLISLVARLLLEVLCVILDPRLRQEVRSFRRLR